MTGVTSTGGFTGDASPRALRFPRSAHAAAWRSILMAAVLAREGGTPGAQSPRDVTGRVPAALGAASRVTWVSGEDRISDDQIGEGRIVRDDVRCVLLSPTRWMCSGLTAATRGLAIVVGADAVAAVPVGPGSVEAAGGVARADAGVPGPVTRWGRPLRIAADAVRPDDLQGVRVAAWKPARSSARPNTRRFVPIADAAVLVTRFSESLFWVGGGFGGPGGDLARNATGDLDGGPDGNFDRDGFVRVEGPGIRSVRLSTANLAEGPPDAEILLLAQPPATVSGRVQTGSGEDVPDATVDVFEPLSTNGSADASQSRPALIRRARARSAEDGSFSFSGLEPGRYQLLATHETMGGGSAGIDALRDGITITVMPPVMVKGRVIRHDLPLSGARVRFVPDAEAWAASTDPTRHVSAEVLTADDGEFAAALPEVAAGVLQAIAPDGAIARIPVPPVVQVSGGQGVPGDRGPVVRIGDVRIPDPRRAMLRVLEGPACPLLATGPLGLAGLTIVRPAPAANATWWLEVPEPGAWVLSASCPELRASVDPPVVTVAADGPEPIVDVRVVPGVPRVPPAIEHQR